MASTADVSQSGSVGHKAAIIPRPFAEDTQDGIEEFETKKIAAFDSLGFICAAHCSYCSLLWECSCKRRASPRPIQIETINPCLSKQVHHMHCAYSCDQASSDLASLRLTCGIVKTWPRIPASSGSSPAQGCKPRTPSSLLGMNVFGTSAVASLTLQVHVHDSSSGILFSFLWLVD